jgi:uncharacterized membrane protein
MGFARTDELRQAGTSLISRQKYVGGWGFAAGAAAAIGVAPAASAAVQYRVERLYSGGSGLAFMVARAINDVGTVSGDASNSPALGFPAVRWEPGSSRPIPLELLSGGYDGFGFAINNVGDVAGKASTSLGTYAARWHGTAVTQLQPLPGGSSQSVAQGINDSGDVVGYMNIGKLSLSNDRAVRWAAGGTIPTELGNLGKSTSGVTNTYAYAINQAGDAVGSADKYQSGIAKGTRATKWVSNSTTAIELPNFAVSPTVTATTVAYAINNLGVIAGNATSASGTNQVTRAIIWPADGGAPTELPNLGLDASGNPVTSVKAINDAGDVLGYASRYAGGTYVDEGPVLWPAGGTSAVFLKDLISPDWRLGTAYGINNSGIIVGTGGFDPDGPTGPLGLQNASYRLIPVVPEPAVLGMLGTSALLFHRRRRKPRSNPAVMPSV